MTPGRAVEIAQRQRVGRWSLFVAVIWFTGRGASGAPTTGLCTQEPNNRVNCYPRIENFPNSTEEACLAQGCCWKQLDNGGIPCAYDAIGQPDKNQCEKVPPASRLACRNPRFAVETLTEDAAVCAEVGCCYNEDDGECYQPFFEGYELLTLDETHNGWRGTLTLRHLKRGPFGNDLPLLELHVIKVSSSVVRVRITDPSFARYEVLSGTTHTVDKKDNEQGQYEVHFYESPFGVAVTRRRTHEVLFNSTPDIHASTTFNGLVFENQYLEISTHLEARHSTGSSVHYGLSEQHKPRAARMSVNHGREPSTKTKSSEAKQHGGVHPFYLQILESGRSHGVFFLSSNAMEVVTQQRALTFRSTGGVLDFFVFTGPTSADVTNDYTKLVGRPEMPPIWALGYHFGKRGHQSLTEAALDVAKLRLAGLPFDSYWQDTSYTFKQEAFTLDERSFPLEETRAFIDDLHFNNQYFILQVAASIPTEAASTRTDDVVVVDSGHHDLDCDSASGEENAGGDSTTYYPLERGVELDVFVKGVQGQEFAEKRVGPQWSAFVDFFHPNATTYWHEMLHSFHSQVLPFDGVWTEGSAPSSSCDAAFAGRSASCESYTRHDEELSATVSDTSLHHKEQSNLLSSGEDGRFVRSVDIAYPFDPFRQPFVPGQDSSGFDEAGNMNAGTLPMASIHHQSLHYNLHSLYGHAQARSTRTALNKVLGRRSLSMSGSSFPGSGHYAGHLLAESRPTWSGLRQSISDVVAMNLAGMPLVGSRIGGWGPDVSKELNIRWHQAASFFPLAVTQITDSEASVHFDQESVNMIRGALLRRYRHLPYLYTQFYRAHEHGQPLVRALAFDFPNDPHVFDIDTQYLVGPGLMIAPVVDDETISKNVYFPNATWYDLETGRRWIRSMTEDHSSSRFELVPASLVTLPTFVRGGYIIPTQHASTTVAMTKRGVYTLTIALDGDAAEPSACGELFLDDGDSLNSIQDGRFSLIAFEAKLTHPSMFELSSKRLVDGYDGPEVHVDIGTIVVYGLSGAFRSNSTLHIYGVGEAKADFFEHANMLVITQLHGSIGDKFKLSIEAKTEAVQAESGSGGSTEADQVSSSGSDHSDDDAVEHGDTAVPVTGEQHGGKKGITALGIIGIIALVAFTSVILFVVMRRRYRGYNPIA